MKIIAIRMTGANTKNKASKGEKSIANKTSPIKKPITKEINTVINAFLEEFFGAPNNLAA